MAPVADCHPLPQLRAMDRRAFLLRAAASGVAVPLLSTLTMAHARAASEIKFVAMDYDAHMQEDTQQLVDAFNTSQSDVTTDLQVVSWDEGHVRLVTWISGNQPPDLANVSAGWMVEFDAIGALEPLDDKFAPGFLDAFVPSALDAMKINGRLMGLPYFLDPRALYYRKDLFEQAGIQPPATWDEVRAAAKALHHPPDVYGIGTSNGNPSGGYDYYEYAFIGGGGTSRYGPDGKSLLNSEIGVNAAQFLTDLARTDQTTQPNPVNASRDTDLQPLFLAGKLAILETGPWFPTMLKEQAPDLSYGFTKLPMANASVPYHNAFWPDAVVMFKESQNKAAAAKFLEYQFNKENRLAFAQQRGVIPERVDVGADPVYANNDVAKFFVDQLKVSVNVYASPFPHEEQAFQIRTAELAKAFLGEKSPKEAMDSAAEQIDTLNEVA
jgi:ABC-type glycerol-3-phosphate transport system substrate-binding protein